MSTGLLVDAIVRQTVVLVATLATGAGQRPSLSHIADQVFANLVRALREQGLSNKVIADMFGMALRTYHTRVAQLTESRSAQGRSLWEAVYSSIQSQGPVLRAEVHERFVQDDPVMVRAVLRDLVDSGLVYKTGRGDATRYRARETAGDEGELHGDERALGRMLLVAVHRHGPLSREELMERVPADEPEMLDAALAELVSQGVLEQRGQAEAARYTCERCVIPFGDEHGWEAAVFDHYQAMVAALVTKLRTGKRRAEREDRIGGSTFVFDLYEGHPLQQEALGYLEAMRTAGLSLRARLDALSGEQPPPGAAPLRVIAYVGQTIVEQEREGEDE